MPFVRAHFSDIFQNTSPVKKREGRRSLYQYPFSKQKAKVFCALSSAMGRKFFFSHLMGLIFRFRVTGLMLGNLYEIALIRTTLIQDPFTLCVTV